MERRADPYAHHLGAAPLATELDLLIPLEALGTLLQSLFEEGAAEALAFLAVLAAAVGGIDHADGDAIEIELARRLVEDRLHGERGLVFAWATLRAAERRIGEHRNALPAHRQRLIDDRQRVAEVLEIPEADIGAVLRHHIGIHRGDAAVGPEAHLDAALEARATLADRVFLGPAHAHHPGSADLARHVRRD